jgi:hypothetical protein
MLRFQPCGSLVRMLIISPFFPPMVNAEAFCAGKFVGGLMSAGVGVSVIYSRDAVWSGRDDPSRC